MILFDILSVLILIAFPVCVILAYRQGVKDGKAIKEEKPLQQIVKSRAKGTVKSSDDRFDKILQNIDNYDGTGAGQIDV